MAFVATTGYYIPPTARGTVNANGSVTPSGEDGIQGAVQSYDFNTHTPYPLFNTPAFEITLTGNQAAYGYIAAGGAVLAAGGTCSLNAATGVFTPGAGPWIAVAAFGPTSTQADYGWVVSSTPLYA